MILAIPTFLLTQLAFALPRFALTTGAKCSSCHVNPTGGQMRTEYGSTFSPDLLPLRASRDEDFAFSGKLNDNISIGGDYRSQFIWDQFSKTTTFQSMTTSLYGGVKLSKKFSFYFKQDIVNGTYNGPNAGLYNGTEVYGLARPSTSWFIQGGMFLPDYGWRVDDHTAYTRGGDLGYTSAGSHQGLLFVPNYKDIGVEVGGYIENLSITAGIFNGTGHLTPIDFSKHKSYSGKLEYMGALGSTNFRLGVSGYGFRSFHMGGVHFGIGGADSCLVLFGEMDWTHNTLSITPNALVLNEQANTMAAFAELDYRLIEGLWATGRYDVFDPMQGLADDDTSPTTNSVQRVTVGLEFFPYSFVEVRPQFRFTLEKPSVSDNNLGYVQMHVWF